MKIFNSCLSNINSRKRMWLLLVQRFDPLETADELVKNLGKVEIEGKQTLYWGHTDLPHAISLRQ